MTRQGNWAVARRGVVEAGIPLRPDRAGDGVLGWRSARSGIGSPEFTMELYTFKRPVDHGFEFVEILHFASFGEAALRLFGAEPRRPPVRFVGLPHLVDFHQKCFHHELLDASGLPEDALGGNVEVEVTGLDRTAGARFFRRLALSGL